MTKTNREAYREGAVPCEWNPDIEGFAYLDDPFHGVGHIEVEDPTGTHRTVLCCAGCARFIQSVNRAITQGEAPPK